MGERDDSPESRVIGCTCDEWKHGDDRHAHWCAVFPDSAAGRLTRERDQAIRERDEARARLARIAEAMPASHPIGHPCLSCEAGRIARGDA